MSQSVSELFPPDGAGTKGHATAGERHVEEAALLSRSCRTLQRSMRAGMQEIHEQQEVVVDDEWRSGSVWHALQNITDESQMRIRTFIAAPPQALPNGGSVAAFVHGRHVGGYASWCLVPASAQGHVGAPASRDRPSHTRPVHDLVIARRRKCGR